MVYSTVVCVSRWGPRLGFWHLREKHKGEHQSLALSLSLLKLSKRPTCDYINVVARSYGEYTNQVCSATMASKRSSMESVWDTLNAMKARQKAAQSSNMSLRQDNSRVVTAARQKAQALFQSKVDTIIKQRLANNTASSHATDTSEHDCTDGMNEVQILFDGFRTEYQSNVSIAPFIEQCRQRAAANPQKEVQALRELLSNGNQTLAASRKRLNTLQQSVPSISP